MSRHSLYLLLKLALRCLCCCITDTRGRWVFRSSRQRCEHRRPSYDYQCRRWTSQQKAQYNNGRYFTSRLPPCPCLLWQAAWDPRYYVNDAINCAVLAFSFSSTTITQVQLSTRNPVCLLPDNVQLLRQLISLVILS